MPGEGLHLNMDLPGVSHSAMVSSRHAGLLCSCENEQIVMILKGPAGLMEWSHPRDLPKRFFRLFGATRSLDP